MGHADNSPDTNSEPLIAILLCIYRSGLTRLASGLGAGADLFLVICAADLLGTSSSSRLLICEKHNLVNKMMKTLSLAWLNVRA